MNFERRIPMNAKVVMFIIVITLFLIVTLQNTDVATFTILFWKIDMSRIVFMYLSVLVGFIAGFLVAKLTGVKKEDVEFSPEKE